MERATVGVQINGGKLQVPLHWYIIVFNTVPWQSTDQPCRIGAGKINSTLDVVVKTPCRSARVFGRNGAIYSATKAV
eukprot:6193067-Pleurochrysis_carterae.AAC.1